MASFAEEGSPLNKVAAPGFGCVPSAAALDEIERAFTAWMSARPGRDVHTIVGWLGDTLVHRQALWCHAMGGTNNDTELLQRIEDLVPGSEVWEVSRRYRIHRYRHSDAQRQTVEVEMMFNRDIGWRIVATDATRDISASGPPHPDLNVVLAAVRWQDLDGQAVPPPRSSNT